MAWMLDRVLVRAAAFCVSTGCAPAVDGDDAGGSGDAGDAGGDNSGFVFTRVEAVPVGPGVRDLHVVDCDDDGHLDLLTANGDAATMSVSRGRGDGTFEFQDTFAVGQDPWSIATADFNGDGVLDVAVGNFLWGAAVLLGTAGCTFGPPVALFGADPLGPMSSGAYAVAAGDADGDGNADVVAEMCRGDIQSVFALFRGNGDGSFLPFDQLQSGTAAGHIQIVDLDEDGNADIAGVTSWIAGSGGEASHLGVARGLGGSTFDHSGAFQVAHQPTTFDVADFDEDGVLDVVTAGGGLLEPPSLSLLRGLPGATFAPQVTFQLDTMTVNGTAAADLDGDDYVDVALALGRDNVVMILPGLGNGELADPIRIETDPSPGGVGGSDDPHIVAIADFDEDGVLDIAAANRSGTVSVLLAGD